MDYTKAGGISSQEFSNWNYDEEEEKNRKEREIREATEAAEDAPPAPTAQPEEQLPKSSANSVPEGAQGPVITPGDVARVSEKQELDKGLITQVGEALGYVANSDGLTADALNAAAAGLNQLSGGRLQGLDDFFQGSEEQKAAQIAMAEDRAERRAAGEMSGVEQVLDTTLNTVTGIAAGTESGIALPFTLAARLANQDAPWSDPPEVLKNSPVGTSVMKVAEVLVPTLLTGGVAQGLGAGAAVTGTTAVVGESAIETIPQRAADDLILGRQVASSFGDIANYLGYDGNQLTQDLIEGKKPNAQALNAAVGFFQNLGINFGANKVLDYFFKPSSKAITPSPSGDVATEFQPGMPRGIRDRLPGQRGLPTTDPAAPIQQVDVRVLDDIPVDEASQQAAKILGESAEDVSRQALDEVNIVPYRADVEPADVLDVDNFKSTARPSEGNTAVSEAAMMREIMRGSEELKRSGTAVGRDGFTDSNRSYFTNWKAITDDESLQAALEEMTFTYNRLDKFPNEAQNVMLRAKQFWQNNKALLEDGPEEFAKALYERGAVAPMDARKGMGDFEGMDWRRAMREEMGVTEEGFTVMALAGEQLGVQVSKMGRMLNQLEFGGQDFTNAMEVFVQFHEKADLLLVPLRRAKRKWSVEGFAQQSAFQKQVSKLSKSNIATALKEFGTPTGSLEDLTKIGFNDADPGLTLRQMWDAYKAGDEQAGKTLKAYVNFMGSIPPSAATGQMRMMNQIIDRYMKNGSQEAIRSLWYAALLATTEPIKAALGGGVSQVLLQPVGNLARGAAGIAKNRIPGLYSKTGDVAAKRAFMYGMGQVQGLALNAMAPLKVMAESFADNKLIHQTQRLEGLTAKTKKQKELELEFAHKNIMDRLERENASDWTKLLAKQNYLLQLAGLHPALQLPNRLLTSIDQMAISAVGNQEAFAQGLVKAWEDGKLDQAPLYIKASTESIFADGIKTGRVMRQDVLEAAQQITFQQDIPMGVDANWADNAFKAIEMGTKNSGVFAFYNPFVRVSYNFLDKTAMSEPTGFLASRVPRYRKIISGGMGPSKEMQLKSGMAQTQLLMASIGTLALTGGVIGKNAPAGMEDFQDHFIIPNPVSKSGFTAVPFGKLQPYAAYISLTADAVNGFRNKTINTTQYGALVLEMLFSISMNTLDQSFMQGLQKFTRDFDIENIDKSVASISADLLSTPFSIARQPLGVFQPYETVNRDSVDGLNNWMLTFRQRAAGGLGNPIRYNRYTGEPILKNGNLGGDYWEGVLNNVANVFGYPGEIKDAAADTPVFKKLNEVDYDTEKWNKQKSAGLGDFKTPLTANELSELDRLTGDPNVGALQRRLNELFATDSYQNLVRSYNAERKRMDKTKSVLNQKQTADALLKKIHNVIDEVYDYSRDQALKEMLMSGKFPGLQERRDSTDVENFNVQFR